MTIICLARECFTNAGEDIVVNRLYLHVLHPNWFVDKIGLIKSVLVNGLKMHADFEFWTCLQILLMIVFLYNINIIYLIYVSDNTIFDYC